MIDSGLAGRRGFALMAALWFLVLLGSVGLQISLHARNRRLVAANVLDDARARQAARAGLEDACEALARRAPVRDSDRSPTVPPLAFAPWEPLGRTRPDTEALGDERYVVTVSDADAKLDLNESSEEELRRFFISLDVDAGDADKIVDATLDWRDADDLRRARGAEREQYLHDGSAAIPRNGPLHSVSELRLVSGVSPATYAKARPYLSVGGASHINLNSAARPVLLSLPGIGEEAASVLVAARGSAREVTSLEDLSSRLSPGARRQLQDAIPRLLTRVTFRSEEFEIRSEGWTDGGAGHVVATALVVRSGRSIVTLWRRFS